MESTSVDLLKYLKYNIGHQRIIELHYCEGNQHIELISFDKSPSGNYSRTTSKSLKLSLQALKVIDINIDTIKEKFEQVKKGEPVEYFLHLGNLLYLRIDENIKCVDIRKHYLPTGKTPSVQNLRPGVPGIGLKIIEFTSFIALLQILNKIAQIDSLIPCNLKDDHKELSFLQSCKFCNPLKLYY